MKIWNRWKRTTISNQLLVVVGGAACVFTALYTLAFFFQLCLMNQAGAQAADRTDRLLKNLNWLAQTMDRSLRQAERATEASKAALDASIEASRTDQRAWVGIIEVATPPEINAETLLRPVMYLINTGKTPAINVVQTAGYIILPKDKRLAVADLVKSTGRFFQGVIMPNGRRVLSVDDLGIAGPVRANQLNSGEYRLYLFGKITYSDIFKRQHETLFCLRLELTKPMGFATYGPYNNAN